VEATVSRMIYLSLVAFLCALFSLHPVSSVAGDSDWNRKTLTGIQGVHVIVEDLQSNIKKQAQKVNLSKEQLTREVEQKLLKSGIKVLSQEEWLKTKGRPVLYVNINSHEYEKYSYAFDIRVELAQIVAMEINPAIKLLTGTWSNNVTGAVNIGNMHTLGEKVTYLVDGFINAYYTVNPKK
jgi:hypothetical protein